jgi:hypothetical protein
MAINDSTNKYSPNTIIVDSAGKTPFTTVASGITAAVALGVSNPTVYIRAGTYTENLTLVNGVNLCGDDPYTCIIDGHHNIPAAGQIQISNLKLTASVGATSIFNETGAHTCAIDVISCIFNITSGMVFNLPTSTGPLTLAACNDISAANSIINNTTGLSILSIRSCEIGSGAVAAEIAGATYMGFSRVFCPINRIGAQTLTAANCHFSNTMVLSGTSSFYATNSSFDVGAAIALTVGAGCTATLANVTVDSTVGGSNCITGAGSITLSEVTFTNAAGVTTTTKDYTTNVTTGSLRLNSTNAGVLYATSGLVGSTAALTDGQLLIGNSGNPPSVATLSAGTNIGITNAAGTVTVNCTGAAAVTWIEATIATTLAVNKGYITKIAIPGLLTYTLPATAVQGDTIEIVGYSAGGFSIAQNATNQSIRLGNVTSTIGVGGSVSSTLASDSLKMVCVTGGASTEWVITYAVGAFTIV